MKNSCALQPKATFIYLFICSLFNGTEGSQKSDTQGSKLAREL